MAQSWGRVTGAQALASKSGPDSWLTAHFGAVAPALAKVRWLAPKPKSRAGSCAWPSLKRQSKSSDRRSRGARSMAAGAGTVAAAGFVAARVEAAAAKAAPAAVAARAWRRLNSTIGVLTRKAEKWGGSGSFLPSRRIIGEG